MNKNKKLYNTQNISELIDKGLKGLEVDSNIIFTPSAMDILRANGIKVIHKNDCYSNETLAINNNNISNENIVENLTKLLINKYAIKDENTIKKVIDAVLKEIS